MSVFYRNEIDHLFDSVVKELAAYNFDLAVEALIELDYAWQKAGFERSSYVDMRTSLIRDAEAKAMPIIEANGKSTIENQLIEAWSRESDRRNKRIVVS